MIRLVITLFILLISIPAHSTITFDENGRWETTFDCAEQTLPSFTCGDVEIYLDNTASDGSHSVIGTAYNNSSGGGGRGYAQVNGYGNLLSQGVGINDDSETIQFQFFTPQKEFWARYYVRFPSNWEADVFGWIKLMYIQTNGEQTTTLFEPDITGYRLATQGGQGNGIYYSDTGTTLADTLGGFYIGDDTWHCMEVHLKMDTDRTDGVGEIWIDDVLILHRTNLDLSRGITSALDGFTRVVPILNQAKIVNVNDSFARVFLDDVVIYNTTPPNQDAFGNPYIGPLEAGPTYDPPTITGPEDFSTTESSVEINGSYATDPDLPDQSVIVMWTLGENTGFAVAALGVFSCTVPVELSTNSIVFRVVDSAGGEDEDTTVVARTAPPSGNVIYTGSMSGGTYR